jgi:predicted MPP superfamily phosphohydrolase
LNKIVTIFFNFLLFVLDLTALYRVKRSISASPWCFVMRVTILAEILLAAMFAKDHFDFTRLAAYIVFLHGWVFAVGFAAIFWRKRIKLAVMCGASAAALPVLAYYVFLIEPFWLETSYRQIVSPKIHRALRIVVLADLQTDAFGDYERGVLRRVMEEKPDLILLGGDYIQISGKRYGAISREINAFLREIRLSAPYGVFAVRGNVDPAGWPEIFADLGVTCVDVRKSFDLGPLRLTCLGLFDSFNTSTVVGDPDPGKFHIVFGHAPNYALGDIGADLLVAGHTHGGQVRFPLIGPIVTNCRVPRSWAAGLSELPGGRMLLVSRGIGMERDYAPRMRFLCRPELMVIDLIPQK